MKTPNTTKIEQIELSQNAFHIFGLLMPVADFSPQIIVQCVVQIT